MFFNQENQNTQDNMDETVKGKRIAYNAATSFLILTQLWISINDALQMAHALIISLDLCQIHLCEESALKDKKKTCINLELHFQLLKKSLSFWKFSDAERGWMNICLLITRLSSGNILHTCLFPSSRMLDASRYLRHLFMHFPRPGSFPTESQCSHIM